MRLFGSMICSALIGQAAAGAGDTPNQRLKKNFRKTIEIVDQMLATPVSKEEADRAIGISGNAEQEDDLLRRSDTMISDRIHKSWVTKVVKQTSFLQKKYNSADCRKFGNPNQDDVSDVWDEFGGDKIKDQYNLFGKLIWPASAADGLRGRQTVEEAPLTNLWLQFARWRLWINENISTCYDESNPKATRAGAQRVKKWRNKAHRKFDTLESRVCTHLFKGLVKTKESDNPYKENPSCDQNQFKMKIKDEKRKIKQEQRLEEKSQGR